MRISRIFDGVAFGHREGDVDAVALLRRHRGHDLGGVEAARQVLALELLLGAVDERLVERQALADAEVLQRLDQVVLLELLHADEVDAGDDRRAPRRSPPTTSPVDVDPHVLEQARGEQRAQRRGALLVGVGVADAERQRREHGAGIGALQAFDADVLAATNGLDRQAGRASGRGRRRGDAERGGAGAHRPGGRAGKGMRSVIGGPAGGPCRCRAPETSSSA